MRTDVCYKLQIGTHLFTTLYISVSEAFLCRGYVWVWAMYHKVCKRVAGLELLMTRLPSMQITVMSLSMVLA